MHELLIQNWTEGKLRYYNSCASEFQTKRKAAYAAREMHNFITPSNYYKMTLINV